MAFNIAVGNVNNMIVIQMFIIKISVLILIAIANPRKGEIR